MKNKRIAIIKKAIKKKRVNESSNDESDEDIVLDRLVLLRIFANILKIVHFRWRMTLIFNFIDPKYLWNNIFGKFYRRNIIV